jgi:hypothetical protein
MKVLSGAKPYSVFKDAIESVLAPLSATREALPVKSDGRPRALGAPDQVK